MSFPTSAYMRKAGSRAKSDVANKLVSMLLHGLSRKICASLGLSVTDATYADDVEAAFGSNCCYCSQPLERDRAAVEHLDGMNRFRLGLHIPGNVIVACKRCNGEKRRDDQLPQLTLAESGWESFVSHDSTRCEPNCKTCAHWKTVWPDLAERVQNTRHARERILAFRARYPESLQWSGRTQNYLRQSVDRLYRECQEFAAIQAKRAVDEAFSDLTKAQSSVSPAGDIPPTASAAGRCP
ncbi:MAG: hypothetical protein WA188_22855 [Terriglobales bacterium]